MQDEMKAAQKLVDIIIDFFVNYSFQVVGAILVLIIGVIVARTVSSFLLRLFERKDFDITLSKSIASAVRITILVFVIIVALGKFGISVAPFTVELELGDIL